MKISKERFIPMKPIKSIDPFTADPFSKSADMLLECARCGAHILSEKDKYCIYCGQKIRNDSREYEKDNETSMKEKSTPMKAQIVDNRSTYEELGGIYLDVSYKCPRCNADIGFASGEPHSYNFNWMSFEYCNECGQMIDWPLFNKNEVPVKINVTHKKKQQLVSVYQYNGEKITSTNEDIPEWVRKAFSDEVFKYDKKKGTYYIKSQLDRYPIRKGDYIIIDEYGHIKRSFHPLFEQQYVPYTKPDKYILRYYDRNVFEDVEQYFASVDELKQYIKENKIEEYDIADILETKSIMDDVIK